MSVLDVGANTVGLCYTVMRYYLINNPHIDPVYPKKPHPACTKRRIQHRKLIQHRHTTEWILTCKQTNRPLDIVAIDMFGHDSSRKTLILFWILHFGQLSRLMVNRLKQVPFYTIKTSSAVFPFSIFSLRPFALKVQPSLKSILLEAAPCVYGK